MTQYELKQDDTATPFVAQLYDANGPIPLEDTDTVFATARGKRSLVTYFLDVPCEILDAVIAKVRIDPFEHDEIVSLPGVYDLEWKIVHEIGAGEQRVPNNGYDTLIIWEKLDVQPIAP